MVIFSRGLDKEQKYFKQRTNTRAASGNLLVKGQVDNFPNFLFSQVELRLSFKIPTIPCDFFLKFKLRTNIN